MQTSFTFQFLNSKMYHLPVEIERSSWELPDVNLMKNIPVRFIESTTKTTAIVDRMYNTLSLLSPFET